MFRKLFIPLCIFGLVMACKTESEPEVVSEGVATERAENNPDQIPDSLIFFTCTDITQESDQSAHYEIYINIGNSEVKVSDTENCARIESEFYADYQLPAETIDAIGDADRVTYIVREGIGKVLVREGTKQDDGTFNYRAISSFTTLEMPVNPNMDKTALVGTYGTELENADQSYLLFVGMSNRFLNAQLFSISGELPAQDKLVEAMRGADPELLRDFVVNMMDLTFESSLGSGKFIKQGENMQVQFDDIETPDKKPLVLDRF